MYRDNTLRIGKHIVTIDVEDIYFLKGLSLRGASICYLDIGEVERQWGIT